MKKLLVILIMVFCLNFNSFSQSIFQKEDKVENTRGGGFPGLPNHGEEGNQPAPIGSGVLMLTALGAGYMLSKKHKD